MARKKLKIKKKYMRPVETKKVFGFVMDGRKIDVKLILIEVTYDLNTNTEIISVEVQT